MSVSRAHSAGGEPLAARSRRLDRRVETDRLGGHPGDGTRACPAPSARRARPRPSPRPGARRRSPSRRTPPDGNQAPLVVSWAARCGAHGPELVGAIRALELDIDPEWESSPGRTTNLTPLDQDLPPRARRGRLARGPPAHDADAVAGPTGHGRSRAADSPLRGGGRAAGAHSRPAAVQAAHRPTTAKCRESMTKPNRSFARAVSSAKSSSGASMVTPQVSQTRCPWGDEARW